MKVVKLTFPVFVLLMIIGVCCDVFSQTVGEVDMKRVVIIERKEARFEDFLNSVSRQSGVVFSFSTTKIAADKILTLVHGKQTLEAFLNQLKAKTGLDYKIVGTHIIFLDKKPAPVANQSAKAISKSGNKPVTARPSLQAGQTQPTHLSSLGSEERSQSGKVSATDTASHPLIDSIQALEKNDTLAQHQKQLSNSALKDTDSTLGRNIDNRYGINADTTRIDYSAGGAIKGSAGNFSRDSERKAERTESKVIWFIGADISRITGFENQNETFQATGFGGVIKMESAISRKFSLTAELGFKNFTGKYTYTRFSNSPGDTTSGLPKDTTIDNFDIAPFLVGMKYYFAGKFYLSAELGLAFKASSATRTKLALSPSLGVLLPTGRYNHIDLSLRFTHIVSGYGIPESNGLENGGYGFLSIRAAYGIGGKRFRKGL